MTAAVTAAVANCGASVNQLINCHLCRIILFKCLQIVGLCDGLCPGNLYSHNTHRVHLCNILIVKCASFVSFLSSWVVPVSERERDRGENPLDRVCVLLHSLLRRENAGEDASVATVTVDCVCVRCICPRCVAHSATPTNFSGDNK